MRLVLAAVPHSHLADVFAVLAQGDRIFEICPMGRSGAGQTQVCSLHHPPDRSQMTTHDHLILLTPPVDPWCPALSPTQCSSTPPPVTKMTATATQFWEVGAVHCTYDAY